MSFTDATAFSPTPAVPRSRPARLLMVVQQLASLLAGALVVARAGAVLV